MSYCTSEKRYLSASVGCRDVSRCREGRSNAQEDVGSHDGNRNAGDTVDSSSVGRGDRSWGAGGTGWTRGASWRDDWSDGTGRDWDIDGAVIDVSVAMAEVTEK